MRRFQTLAAYTLAFALLTAANCPALDLGLPDLEDVAGDAIKDKIPGLDDILKEEPAVSTSFEDAVYGAPVLDRMNPAVTAPMSQLPATGDGAYVVALPGMYELEAKSFCLHAGKYGPGRGDGYLWAPLKGKQAGVIRDILDNYMTRPEIEQQKVQSLIWGIQARAKISEMPDELQDVARELLTRKQIRKLNGGALGLIPNELMDQAFVDVPDEVRMVMEAEARLRNRLRQEVYDFDALEEVAVLSGRPDYGDEGPIIPAGRWSWEPEGFFVRFDPHGYSHTTIQLYAPESFRAVTDDLGRITSLVDRAGTALELQYASDVPAATEGDVSTWALASVRLTAPDGETAAIACTAEDTVVTGVTDDSAVLEGIRELASHVDGASEDSALAGNVANLAHVADTLSGLAGRGGLSERDLRTMQAMGHRAVASELALLLEGAENETAFRPAERETRLAMLPWATGTVLDLAQAARGNPGGGFFRPSGGTAQPADNGPQRLGLSGGSRELPTYRPPDRDDDEDEEPSGGEGKGAMSSARDSIDMIQKGKDAIEIVSDVQGWAAGKIGMGIPDYLFGKILDFNLDAWARAAEALGGDPPVEDYDEIAMPEPISLPAFAPAEEVSPEHTAAVNALADALEDNFAVIRAANITEDRLGGALAADDDEWAMRQASALVDYKHQAGAGFQEIAVALDELLLALRNAGVNQITVTREAAEAYQQRLRTEGWNAEEQQAAEILGISEAELQQSLAERIAADPNDLAGDLMETHSELADALWWLGASWQNLPEAEPAP